MMKSQRKRHNIKDIRLVSNLDNYHCLFKNAAIVSGAVILCKVLLSLTYLDKTNSEGFVSVGFACGIGLFTVAACAQRGYSRLADMLREPDRYINIPMFCVCYIVPLVVFQYDVNFSNEFKVGFTAFLSALAMKVANPLPER